MMRRIDFKVSLVAPPGATVNDIKDYVHDAVSSWRGSLRPPGGYSEDDAGDPMFSLDVDTVRVTMMIRKMGEA